jgi:Bacterial Ig domain/Right handed beta helix region/Protein of unknown function (DUF1565)
MKIKHVVGRLCLPLFIASLTAAQAGTLYVATTGSDSNPGTAAQPFRTITYAYSQASAGTTILVAPGTYTDYQSGWGLHLGKSGTASNPIVLESQVRGGAVIDGQFASDRNDAIYIDGSYNVVEGFEIKNGPNEGVTVWGNGNQILNNEIDHNGTPASSTDTQGHDGVYESHGLSGNTFIGNFVHDNGRAGGSNLDHGLYLCGNNDVVANNVVIRNDSRGLQIAGYTTVSNMKVYNNVFAWNGKDGITVWMAMNGVDIKNNIIYNNGLYGIEFYAATGSGVVVDHNLAYGNGSGSYDTPSDGGGTVSVTFGANLSSDPKFANETQSSFDAHLSAGSPAIGAGYNFYSLFTTDLAGAARPSSGAWDLGAYVYGSSGSSGSGDTTPPTVSITAPAAGVKVSGSTVALSANASDNVAVASVQFKLDGANLGSALTASPYTMTWDSTAVADGSHTLTAVATDTSSNRTTSAALTFSVSNAVIPVLSLPSFPSTAGVISAPFYVTNSGLNSAIVQPAYTDATSGGQAVYTFNVPAAGSYVVSALVNAPSTDNNSFFVNIDAQPTDPMMIWDVPVKAGFASETVSWRGSGTADTNSPSGMTAQYSPVVFALTAGTHQLIIRGREGLVQLGTITIAPYVQSDPPTVSITAPANGATVSGSGISVLASASSSVGIAGVQFQLDGADIGPVFTNAPYGGAWNSTTVADGPHVFTAVATDTAGNQAASAPVTILVSNSVPAPTLPAVSVAATTPNASRVGPVDGAFTITRSGDTSGALTVNYSLGGTAANGVDYALLGGSATIPAGATSTPLTVAPLPSASYVGTETAVLTLTASSAYTAGSTASATVSIAGNTVPSTIGSAPGHNVKITWKSVVGKVYVVAYKNSLSDASWTNLSGPITAKATSTSYTDTTAGKNKNRYYVVYVTD